MPLPGFQGSLVSLKRICSHQPPQTPLRCTILRAALLVFSSFHTTHHSLRPPPAPPLLRCRAHNKSHFPLHHLSRETGREREKRGGVSCQTLTHYRCCCHRRRARWLGRSQPDSHRLRHARGVISLPLPVRSSGHRSHLRKKNIPKN